MAHAFLRDTFVGGEVEIEEGDEGCHVIFPGVDLRPSEQRPLPSISIFADWEHRGQVLSIGWAATSKGVDGVSTGTLEASVGVNTMPVVNLLRDIRQRL
jgi:hypothetical protein